MSVMFSELIQGSRRVSKDEFAINFGGIAGDVVELLNSEQAQQITREARAVMENALPFAGGRIAALRQVEFGLFSSAPELERGEVAAVDGTFPLPMQLYSAGQALCVGISSLSHRRPVQDALHYWSSRAYLNDARDTDDVIARQERGLFGISQTAFLRYFEAQHALEIEEPLILFDGTLIYEWLVATREGVNLYERLFASGKRCLGVVKSIKANVVFSRLARALRSGEVYVIETLADHLDNSNAANRNAGEQSARYALSDFRQRYAPHILRGIFKPRQKTFGFEVHEDHFDDMLRTMAADCQLNHVGHEIPYLLNRVDEEVRRSFSQRLLPDRIAAQMATEGEGLFFEETNERQLR